MPPARKTAYHLLLWSKDSLGSCWVNRRRTSYWHGRDGSHPGSNQGLALDNCVGGTSVRVRLVTPPTSKGDLGASSLTMMALCLFALFWKAITR